MTGTMDQTKPVLIMDLRHPHTGGAPLEWGRAVRDGRFAGAILEATQGAADNVDRASWFASQWPALKASAGDAYGVSWFRGCYHRLLFRDDPVTQAEAFVHAIERAGGVDEVALPPVAYVTRGTGHSPNQQASGRQIVDCTSRFVERVKRHLGRKVMLHGREAMQELALTSRMGCDYLWAPRYLPALEDRRFSVTAIGWRKNNLMLWQYTDGASNFTAYPGRVPGIGACGISVFAGAARGLHGLRALIDDSKR